MKLIYCPQCSAIFSLSHRNLKYCDCGVCCGKYDDDKHHAVVSGDGISIAIDTTDIMHAMFQHTAHDGDISAIRLECWARPHSDPELNPRTRVDENLGRREVSDVA
jgi:hypothetical protein